MSTCNSKVATCAEKQNRVGEGERFMVVYTEQSERPNSRSKSKVELTGHYQVVIERKSPSRDGLVKPIYATTQPQLLPPPSRAASTGVAGAGSASGVSMTP